MSNDLIKSFKIWNDHPEHGYPTHIEIDGEDVSHCINEIAVYAAVNGPVQVAMDSPIFEQEMPGRPLRLVFPMEGTRELLIRHGWTPPAESA